MNKRDNPNQPSARFSNNPLWKDDPALQRPLTKSEGYDIYFELKDDVESLQAQVERLTESLRQVKVCQRCSEGKGENP